MPHTIKFIRWFVFSGVLFSLTSWALAEQPVKIEPLDNGLWRLTTTLSGQADRLDWAVASDQASSSVPIDLPTIQWANNRGFVEIEWLLMSDGPPDPETWVLMRAFNGQTDSLEISIDPSFEVIGPVGSGMTLWRIASEWLANWGDRLIDAGEEGASERSPPTMPEWMDWIMQTNPQAFETDEANSLMRGAMLRHPIKSARATHSQSADVLPIEATHAETVETGSSQSPANAPFLNPVIEPSAADGLRVEQLKQALLANEQLNIDALFDRPIRKQDALDQALAPLSPDASWSDPVASNRGLLEFGFLDQPDWWRQEQQMGTVALVLGLVVVCLLILHGWSRVGGAGRLHERAQTKGASGVGPPTMAPEAVTITLDLAERYLAMGDAAQALHWLEEVIAHGTAKEVRQAKRLWRQALALMNGGPESGSTAS